MRIEIEILNRGDRPGGIWEDFAGSAETLVVAAFDSDGRPVGPRGIRGVDDSRLLRDGEPKLRVIEPGGSTRTRRDFRVGDLVPEAGVFTLTVSYVGIEDIAPHLMHHTSDVPIWDGASGPLQGSVTLRVLE